MARAALLQLLVVALAANSAAAARTLQLFGKGAVAPAAVQPVVVQAAYAPQPVVTYSYATAPVVVGAVYPQAAPVNKVNPKEKIKSVISSIVGQISGGGDAPSGPQPAAAYQQTGAVMTAAPVVIGSGGGVIVSGPAPFGGAPVFQQPAYGQPVYAQPVPYGQPGGYFAPQPVYGQPSGYYTPQPATGPQPIYGQQGAPMYAQPQPMVGQQQVPAGQQPAPTAAVQQAPPAAAAAATPAAAPAAPKAP